MSHSSSSSSVQEATARKWPRSFIACESAHFRWLLVSHWTFFMAMQGQFLIRSLLAWQLTDSELSLAYVNLAIAIPMVFGSFVAGAVIDRVERKKLVMLSQTLILCNELIVFTLLLLGKLAFWHLLSTSFVLGLMFPFVMPTRIAMIYSLVGRDRMANAMALQAGAMNLARVMGPAIVGLLIAVITLEGAYFFAISLYLISTGFMLKLPLCHPEQREKKSLFVDIKYSFTYVGRHRAILLCLLFGLFPMLLVMPIFSLLVVFADEVWQTGESGLGMLMAMLGSGGILGAFWVAHMGNNIRRTRFMIIAALIFTVLLSVFSMTESFMLALLLLLLASVFSNVSMTLNNTLVQLLAHDEVRGRMSSLVMISFGLTPLGVLPIAFASERIGVSLAVFSACIILFMVVIGFFVLSPTLRNLDTVMAENDADEKDV